MKKLVIVAIIAISTGVSFAQSNTFPTNGNVGIGTTSPSKKLHVVGAMLLNGEMVTPGLTKLAPDQNKEILIIDANTNKIYRSGIAEISEFMYNKSCSAVGGVVAKPNWAAGSNKIYIGCPEVNVGVGTTSPLYSMDVRGTGLLTSLRLGNTGNTASGPGMIEAERNEAISAPLMRFAVKKTNGDRELKFLVNADGGVECTRLAVRAPENIGVPDYVFLPNYQLRTIDELKTFVNTEHHLPNIPSEAEITANGFDIGEMELKLLEKIEELTLYVIQLNDKIATLEQQNAQMATQIEELQH